MQFRDLKGIFCHGSAGVITFYVISAVLLYFEFWWTLYYIVKF